MQQSTFFVNTIIFFLDWNLKNWAEVCSTFYQEINILARPDPNKNENLKSNLFKTASFNRSQVVSTILFSFLFFSFSYSGVCSNQWSFLFMTSQMFTKSSKGDGNSTFYGWDQYFHRTLCVYLHCWCNILLEKMCKRRRYRVLE